MRIIGKMTTMALLQRFTHKPLNYTHNIPPQAELLTDVHVTQQR